MDNKRALLCFIPSPETAHLDAKPKISDETSPECVFIERGRHVVCITYSADRPAYLRSFSESFLLQTSQFSRTVSQPLSWADRNGKTWFLPAGGSQLSEGVMCRRIPRSRFSGLSLALLGGTDGGGVQFTLWRRGRARDNSAVSFIRSNMSSSCWLVSHWDMGGSCNWEYWWGFLGKEFKRQRWMNWS